MTQDCWFCLNPSPPYYVGIGSNSSLGSSPTEIKNLSIEEAQKEKAHRWGQEPKLTLGDLQGQGLCLSSLSYNLAKSPYQDSCWRTITLQDSDYTQDNGSPLFLVAPTGTWFACTTGLTPCINPHTRDFGLCILTHVIPQVYFYSGEGGHEHFGIQAEKQKRAPILIPLLIGLGIAGSATIGTTALVTGDQNFKALSQQIDQDLSDLENSVSHLEESLNSLAEAVLQNTRGLDLFFLKQGGLCVALGETCCFYANH